MRQAKIIYLMRRILALLTVLASLTSATGSIIENKPGKEEHYTWQNDTWEVKSVVTNEYDSNGNLLSAYTDYTKSWQSDTKLEIKYNEAGQKTASKMSELSNDQWKVIADTTFTYTAGKLSCMTCIDPYNKKVYTYNEYGQLATEANYSITDGVPVLYYQLKYYYDSVVHDFVTRVEDIDRNNNVTVNFDIKVTRNDAGNVTQFIKTFPTGNGDDTRVTWTYGPDGKATTYTAESYNGETWVKIYEWTGIEWENTDGQLLYFLKSNLCTEEHAPYTTGANRIKTCNELSSVTIVYDGENYEINAPSSHKSYSVKQNGSWEIAITTRVDNIYSYSKTYWRTYDDSGRLLEQNDYGSYPYNKWTYTLDNNNTIIESTYYTVYKVYDDYDVESESEQPETKTVYSEFVPFEKSGIDSIQTDDSFSVQINGNVVSAPDAKTITVFNCQGRTVLESNNQEIDLSNLASAIYIIKLTNNTSSKTIKLAK